MEFLDRQVNRRYNKSVEYEWDEAKSLANVAMGRTGFDAMERFDWDTAVIVLSPRFGVFRWAALGFIGCRLYHVVFTERGNRARIISLRTASRIERRTYDGQQP